MILSLLLALAAGDGRTVEATIYPTVRGESETNIFDAPRIRRGRAAYVAIEKFVDDPADPIIAVRAIGLVKPTTTYKIENRMPYFVSSDDYTCSAYNSISLWSPDRNIIGGLGHSYGKQERSLHAFDGTDDFDGPSGFAQEYGPTIPFWPKFMNDGTPIHWEMSRFCELVSSEPDEWIVVEVRLDQRWRMDYTPAAWTSPHGYSFAVEHGHADLNFYFEAVHESGRVQR